MSGKRELLLIGSQCVHASAEAVPAEVLLSLEVDVVKLADVDTIRARIASVADLHMRAVLLARLQLVLENSDP